MMMRLCFIRRRILSVPFILLIINLFSVNVFSKGTVAEASVQELIARKGLPNFFAKAEHRNIN